MITNSTGKVCKTALSSLLEACESGRKPLPDTINEARLALSLLVDGGPTVQELEPFIGRGWAICRATRWNRERYATCLTPTAYRKAEIKALAARLMLSESFVAARLA